MISSGETKHWFNVFTLTPTGEQMVLDNSLSGINEVFPLRLAPHQRRGNFQNIIDQFGSTPAASKRFRCQDGANSFLKNLTSH